MAVRVAGGSWCYEFSGAAVGNDDLKAARHVAVLQRRRHPHELSIDRGRMRSWLDAALVDEKGIERRRSRDRIDAARGGRERERQRPRARSAPNDHDVKSRLAVRDARAERRKLELALTDADEHERRDVLSRPRPSTWSVTRNVGRRMRSRSAATNDATW